MCFSADFSHLFYELFYVTPIIAVKFRSCINLKVFVKVLMLTHYLAKIQKIEYYLNNVIKFIIFFV